MKATNIKLLSIILLIGGILFFFVCDYSYKSKVDELNQKAKVAFVEALDQELKSRNVEEKLTFFFDTKHSLSAQMPDSVYLEDAAGRHMYKLDSMKNHMNITDDNNLRSLHSYIFQKKPIQPDSLNIIWRECLLESGVSTLQSGLCISTIDEKGNIESQKKSLNEWGNQANCIFTTYIGYACEIEVVGYLHYSVWQIMYLYVLSYLLLYGAFTYGLYKLCIIISKKITVLKQKEFSIVAPVIEEIAPIIEIVKVKEVEGTQINSYCLRENIIFYAQKKKIVVDGVERNIPKQACQLLKLFLDATDYILPDNVILDNLWSNNLGTAELMQKAITRLRQLLREMDSSIDIMRGKESYQLLL